MCAVVTQQARNKKKKASPMEGTKIKKNGPITVPIIPLEQALAQQY